MTSLIPDEPIDNATKFGFDIYSSALASIIKSKSLQTPFTIAIHGDWGSGKTSLMKTVAKTLISSNEDEIKVKTIWFNAWEFEKIPFPLWKIFLNRITMELQEMVPDDELKSKIKATGQGLLILSSDIFLRRTIGLSLDEVKKVKDKVWEDIKRINSLREDFSLYIEEVFKKDPLQRERLVIFIDDLDRCLPEQCIQIFESIKLFLNSKRCIFVIGIDKDQICNAFEIKFGKRKNSSGLNYMEKFIQLQFDLPRKTSIEIQSFLEELASEQLKGSPKTIGLISDFIEPNPRKIKKWINSVLFLEELFRIKQQKQLLVSQIDVSIVSIWLFLKSFFPDFAVLIELDPSLLNSAIRVARGIGSTEDEKKIGDFTMDRRLTEFLFILEPEYKEDRLMEIVYLSRLTPIEQVSVLPTKMLKRILDMPEEELLSELKILTEHGASILADRIIDLLDHIHNYEEYNENLKVFELFNLLFVTAKDNSKIILFDKLFTFYKKSTFGKWYFHPKMKDYTSLNVINKMIIKRGYLDDIITIFAESYSFENASNNAGILLNFLDNFNPDQIKIIVSASLNNGQIYDSFGARRNLRILFEKYKSELSDEEMKKIKELMKITI